MTKQEAFDKTRFSNQWQHIFDAGWKAALENAEIAPSASANIARDEIAALANELVEKGPTSHGIQVLADEFEKIMIGLREEIMSFGAVLNPALRPEPTRGEAKASCPTPVRAPLEAWLDVQVSVARSCIERIQSYRERCVL